MAKQNRKGKGGAKGKVRTQFVKNRAAPARRKNWTREYQSHGFSDEDTASTERVTGKGDLTRQRTVRGEVVQGEDEPGFGVQLEVDQALCLRGRVLTVRGLTSDVRAEDGTVYQCATRRLLKTLATDQRHVVVAGDWVLFRPVEQSQFNEGIIERVEPRHGSLCRTSRGRRHIIVTNIDQAVLVSSAAEPRIKPHLIDRLLVTAEKCGVRPIVCINKIDLVDPAELQPLVGNYAALGYEVHLVSAATGCGIPRLRQRFHGRQSVVTGQSGVGKTSLLNAIDPELALRVGEVSQENEKGRHTTTSAQLIPLQFDGFVVDTPGIRQFQLWDVTPEEVAGFFRDIRPYVSFCRFPDCSHTHESDCAVKDAVADGRISPRRYDSYCHLHAGDID